VRRDYAIVQDLWIGYMDNIGRSDGRMDIETHIRGLDPSDHLGRGTLYCELAVAALGWGAVEQVEIESRRAIHEMRASGSILGVNYAFMHLALGQLLAGRLRESETLYREALSMAEDNFGADSGLKALCRFFVGYCLYLKGDHDASVPLIESWVETTDGWLDVFATAYEVTARQAFARGGLNDAIAVLGDANRVAQERRLDRLMKMAAAWRVEFLTLANLHADAKREASVGGVFAAAELRGVPDFGWRARLAATLAIGRLWAATGATAQALQLVDTARAEFRAAKLLLPARRLDALSIVILKQRGADEEALVRLQDLLDFVVAEGAIGILLEQGRALEGLLNIAQRRNRELVLSGAQRDVIAQVLGRLQRGTELDQHGFSARELEVLRELCNGRSNKAIGQFLDLSENTVKFHLKRVFKKLGTESRAGAITVALQRRLVVSDEVERKK
jgi:LuxR family maltose regulon positive regulatory protein